MNNNSVEFMFNKFKSKKEYKIIEFFPFRDDGRQFCSPGLNLPLGCITRATYRQYPEYHTSGDNLEFVKSPMLESPSIFSGDPLSMGVK